MISLIAALATSILTAPPAVAAPGRGKPGAGGHGGGSRRRRLGAGDGPALPATPPDALTRRLDVGWVS